MLLIRLISNIHNFFIIPGCGSGIIMVMTSTYILMFFDRHRGLAIGIKLCGSALGNSVFPKLIIFLEGEYGFRGNLLLYGGISLNITAIALLLGKPPDVREAQSCPAVQIRRERLKVGRSSERSNPTAREVSSNGTSLHISKHVLLLFRESMFYVILGCALSLEFAKSLFNLTVVDFGLDKGYSLSNAESVIQYCAASDAIGFGLLPILADRKLLSRSSLALTCFILLGVFLFLMPHCHLYAAFVLTSLVIKLCAGCISTLRTVLFADFLGVERVPVCFGLSGLLLTPVLLLNPSITGIREMCIGGVGTP